MFGRNTKITLEQAHFPIQINKVLFLIFYFFLIHFNNILCSRMLGVCAGPPAVWKHFFPSTLTFLPLSLQTWQLPNRCDNPKFGNSVRLSCWQIYGSISVRKFATFFYVVGVSFSWKFKLKFRDFKLVGQRNVIPFAVRPVTIDKGVGDVAVNSEGLEVQSGLKIG